MLAKKTIKAKLVLDSQTKRALIGSEYYAWQRYLHGRIDAGLYSATKQQADRFLKRIGNRFKQNREYPMILRNDVFKIMKDSTKAQYKYWTMIPVADVRGRVLIPIIPGTDFDGEVREGKLVKRNNHFYLYFTIHKEVEETKPSNVLAIDLGVKNVATTVNSANKHTPELLWQTIKDGKGTPFPPAKKARKEESL